ncbi:hypothetical protein HDU98_010855 [Podochytrium sp. JEL0797]|nr:hypothetical protein HDU98_010855 [Podochytrium sp. JEL0797]
MEDELLEELNRMLRLLSLLSRYLRSFAACYRTATLRDFALLRKDAESPNFKEPASWRDLYLEKKHERDEKMLRVKANIRKSNKVAEAQKGMGGTKFIDKHLIPPAKARGWGASPGAGRAAKPMGRAINAVKKEIQILRVQKYESCVLDSTRSSSSSRSSPQKPRVTPHPDSKRPLAPARPPIAALPAAIMVAPPAAKSFVLALPK